MKSSEPERRGAAGEAVVVSEKRDTHDVVEGRDGADGERGEGEDGGAHREAKRS